MAEMVQDARKKKIQVHFASLMDLRHLKHAKLATHRLKYKGRVVFRVTNAKDD